MTDKIAKTGNGTHRATQRGYAGGNIIEEGQAVPADIAVSDVWMEKVKGAKDKMAERIEEVQAPHRDEPSLESLPIDALRLRATEAGVTDTKGLDAKKLIALINAERDRTRTQ